MALAGIHELESRRLCRNLIVNPFACESGSIHAAINNQPFDRYLLVEPNPVLLGIEGFLVFRIPGNPFFKTEIGLGRRSQDCSDANYPDF